MSIKFRSNNAVLNNNARASDVARATLDTIIPIQARRYDSAFQVQGYRGILYNRLSNGRPCVCVGKERAIGERLGLDGRASPEAINEMITGGGEFGIRRYNSGMSDQPGYASQPQSGPRSLEVRLGNTKYPPVVTAEISTTGVIGPRETADGVREQDVIGARRGSGGLIERRATSSLKDKTANLILPEDDDILDDATISDISRFDLGMNGLTDVACPICMGSGFVGGYQPVGGTRKIFCFGDKSTDLILPAEAEIDVEARIPTITTNRAEFYMSYPAATRFVDAFQLWNNTKPVAFPKQFIFEDCPCEMTSAQDLLRYCDGKRHKLTLQWASEVTFTHLEIQFGLSGFEANFELPKLSRSGNQTILENTDPFQIVLSPRVPLVKPLDLIVESTFGKVLEVKSVTGWNDRKRSTLGWEVEVRPVQPQELYALMPRRKPLERLNGRGIVTDNSNNFIQGRTGTSRT